MLGMNWCIGKLVIMVNLSVLKSAKLVFAAGMIILGEISCTAYRNFQIEVLEPALVSIDVSKRIALYDRNIRNAESALRIEKEDTEYLLLREFVNGLDSHRTILEKDTVILLKNNQLIYFKDGKSPQYLSCDTLDFLCRKYKIDYLLSLEMISYKMCGDDINCYWKLCLYQQGINDPIDSVIINKSLLVNTEMPDAMFDDLATAYWEGGYVYAHRIIPTWEKTARRVYRQGRVLALGSIYMETEQVEKAAEIWIRAAEMQNKKSIKANLNLAYLYESTGDYRQAQHYLERAQELTQIINVNHKLMDYIHRYMRILDDRIRKEFILKKQINIDS